ncbi:MAG: hypothetical protein H0X64_12160 [Gemmatimonadaceae bacterium]|nr:hypothetical protein [Gemmatimonadaceae bacterium]
MGLLLAVASGCGTPTEPRSAERLVGSWRDLSEASGHAGPSEVVLTIGSDRSFTWDMRVYGAHPGQDPSAVSGYMTIFGTYTTNGNSLRFTGERRVGWDRALGPDVVEEAYEQDMYENATFQVIRNTLVLRYTTYPADAPQLTTKIFVRVR